MQFYVNFYSASYASVVLAVIVCLSVRPSVRPSVTSRSCTKMAKPRITLTIAQRLYTVFQKNVTLFTFAKTWLNIIQFQ